MQSCIRIRAFLICQCSTFEFVHLGIYQMNSRSCFLASLLTRCCCARARPAPAAAEHERGTGIAMAARTTTHGERQTPAAAEHKHGTIIALAAHSTGKPPLLQRKSSAPTLEPRSGITPPERSCRSLSQTHSRCSKSRSRPVNTGRAGAPAAFYF